MSGKALCGLFRCRLVLGAQVPQNRGGLALVFTGLLCAAVPQGCTGGLRGGSRLCAGAVATGPWSGWGRRGTGRPLLLRPSPCHSWGAARLGTGGQPPRFHWRLQLSVMADRSSLDSVDNTWGWSAWPCLRAEQGRAGGRSGRAPIPPPMPS